MAKTGKKTTSSVQPTQVSGVSLDRAKRLFVLLKHLGQGSSTRPAILKKLKIDIRTFYRDLELLREVGIQVMLENQKYQLNGNWQNLAEQLPFPDPGLSLGDARVLSKGKTNVHQKFRAVIQQICE